MADIEKTYRVGDATVTRIVETMLGDFPPEKLFPGWAGPHPAAAQAPWQPAEPVTLSMNIWIIRLGEKVLMVDTGVGNTKERLFNAVFHRLNTPFLKRLEALGVRPEDVDTVLFTHLHTDHVGWNTRLEGGKWVPTFPAATHVMPKVERDFYDTPAAADRRVVFEDSIAPILAGTPVDLIPEEGGDWRCGISFLTTPGHSPGHMSIRLRSAGEEAIFTGDVMHAPLQAARPELSSIFCAEGEKARASRLRLLDHAARHGSLLFTAHFPATGAGRIGGGPGRYEWRYA